jgi:hypothetical protein
VSTKTASNAAAARPRGPIRPADRFSSATKPAPAVNSRPSWAPSPSSRPGTPTRSLNSGGFDHGAPVCRLWKISVGIHGR